MSQTLSYCFHTCSVSATLPDHRFVFVKFAHILMRGKTGKTGFYRIYRIYRILFELYFILFFFASPLFQFSVNHAFFLFMLFSRNRA